MVKFFRDTKPVRCLPRIVILCKRVCECEAQGLAAKSLLSFYYFERCFQTPSLNEATDQVLNVAVFGRLVIVPVNVKRLIHRLSPNLARAALVSRRRVS